MSLHTKDDAELVRAYVETHSESAFGELVRRHVNWVHAAALRQINDPALAQDVTQSVFLLLARKAAGLSPSIKVSGWLFATTRFVAARARRAEMRRARREQAFSAMNPNRVEPEPLEGPWKQLEPHLDHAVASLSESDRTAVLVRYYERRGLREVGERLGTTEEGARKRVQRALEKLRTLLTRKGASISIGALAALLAERTVQAAPSALAATLLQSTSSMPASLSMPELVDDAIAAWRWGKVKSAAGLAIATAGLLGLLSLILPRVLQQDSPPASATSIAPNVGPVATPTVSTASTSTPGQPRPGPVLAIAAFDAATGRGLANASVYRRVVVQGDWREETGWSTDERGLCLLPLPVEGLQRLDVGVLKPGFAARFATWFPDKDDSIPGNYAFRLAPAEILGGVVLDENNQPVARAAIHFNYHNTGDASARETPRERVGCLDWVPITTTDAAGRWSTAISAPGAENFNFVVRHPDFPRQAFSLGAFDREELKREHAVLRLQTGRRIQGVVLDGGGLPVPGARLWAGDGDEPDARASSNAQGEFLLAHVPVSSVVTVSAEGFELQQTAVELVPEERLTFRLKPAVPLRLQVVDDTGAPVPHATIALENWPGGRRNSVEFREDTDAEGRLVWRSPPSGRLEVCALKRGYRYTREIEMTADGGEHIITMARALVVTGTVTDAESGAPVLEFRAIPGYHPERPNWDRNDRRLGVNGNYALSFTERGAPIIQLLAEGYEPAQAQPQLLNATEGICDFKLRRLNPANDIQGVVQFVDGTPAAGVEVALCTADAGVTLVGTSFEKRVNTPSGWAPLENYRVLTDGEGRFRFRPLPNAHTVVAVSPTGLGKARCHSAGVPLTIQLQPWGQINGVVQIRGQAAANRKVVWVPAGTLTDWQTLSFNAGAISARSDADGRFVLVGVPPGDAHVALQDEPNQALTHYTPVRVAPGESVEAIIGGSGRFIRGTLQAAGRNAAEWPSRLLACELASVWPGIPSQPKNLPPDALQRWRLDFWDSAEALAIRQAKRLYAVNVGPGGSFTVPDVEPGHYDLRARIAITNAAAGAEQRPGMATYLHGRLSVPPAGADSSSPDASAIFDAGEVMLR